MCGLSVEALKRDGVNKRSNASMDKSMDKSFDRMHEKYDFDSIRCSVKKTISISMIVTSVLSTCRLSQLFEQVKSRLSVSITDSGGLVTQKSTVASGWCHEHTCNCLYIVHEASRQRWAGRQVTITSTAAQHRCFLLEMHRHQHTVPDNQRVTWY